MPGRSASLRHTSSYFAACAASSVVSAAANTAHEYVIDGPSTIR